MFSATAEIRHNFHWNSVFMRQKFATQDEFGSELNLHLNGYFVSQLRRVHLEKSFWSWFMGKDFGQIGLRGAYVPLI